mgnify:CR=1 FL=1
MHAHSGRLRLLGLVAVGFFLTCGGPFGVEPLVAAVGPGWALVLLLATPLVFSMPFALVVAELAALMPVEGGYYIWVREALGPFWGVQMAVSSLAAAAMLLALFPVLFSNYVGALLATIAPGLGAWLQGAVGHWVCAVVLIATTVALNIRGTRSVGRGTGVAMAAILAVLGYFVVRTLAAPGAMGIAFDVVRHDLMHAPRGNLLLGLSVILFNYGGWDNTSTIAGEVEDAVRVYPRVLIRLVLLVALSYSLPVFAGLAVTTDPAVWAERGWPAIATIVGGPVLAALLALAGAVSSWGLFVAQILYTSRLPFVLAQDRWVPALLARTHPRTGVPVHSICACGIVAAALAALSYGSLVVMLATFNLVMLALEFASLAAFRRRKLPAEGRFRVPGGTVGLVLVTAAPLAVLGATLVTMMMSGDSFHWQLIANAAVLGGGAIYFVLGRRLWRGGTPVAT